MKFNVNLDGLKEEPEGEGEEKPPTPPMVSKRRRIRLPGDDEDEKPVDDSVASRGGKRAKLDEVVEDIPTPPVVSIPEVAPEAIPEVVPEVIPVPPEEPEPVSNPDVEVVADVGDVLAFEGGGDLTDESIGVDALDVQLEALLGDDDEDEFVYGPVAGGVANESFFEAEIDGSGEDQEGFNPLLDEDDEEGVPFEGDFEQSEVEALVVKLPNKPPLSARDEVNRGKKEALEVTAKSVRQAPVGGGAVDELDAQGGLEKNITYEVSVDDGGRERVKSKGVTVKKKQEWVSEAEVEEVGGDVNVTPVTLDGRDKWVADVGAGRLGPRQLGVFKNLNRAKGREANDELLKEIFSRAEEGSEESEEVARRTKLANRAVFGTKQVAAGSRARFTEKDRDVLVFIGMFKYANAKHIARTQQVKEDTMLKRLYRLSERGLVSKKELYGAKPLWFLTEAGLIASGLEVKRLRDSDITYSMLPHQFVVNHVAGNLWGAGVNVLALEDFPEHYRVGEKGEALLGESLVSEYQVQSSFASAKSANHKSDVYRPAIIQAMNREFTRWKTAGGVEFGPSPEQVRGNEYMWTLFPPMSLRLAYHVPDLVVNRLRGEDGGPNSIAVEVELANKPIAAYERALEAYRYDSLIYKKVIWVVKSRGAARKIHEAAKKIGTWDDERVGIVPIYTEDGIFKGKAEWTI